MSSHTNSIRDCFDRVFKDSEGNLVLWQYPNLALLTWLVLRATSMFVHSVHLKSSLSDISQLFLFAWAYLETTTGVNLFRKSLGVAVLSIIIFTHLK